jgi:hypothetical protein
VGFSICEENHERLRTVERDIWAVEREIAKRIPKPVTTPTPATMRPSANPIAGPHQPLLKYAKAARST